MKKTNVLIAFTVTAVLTSSNITRTYAAEKGLRLWNESSISDKKTKKAFLECKYDAEKVGHVPDDKYISNFDAEAEIKSRMEAQLLSEKNAGDDLESRDVQIRNNNLEIKIRSSVMESYIKNIEMQTKARQLITACMASKGF